MIGGNLQTLRKQFHFSQEEVAEKVGVSRQAVAKWEAGETVPDLHNCILLAQLYNVSLDDLVSYDQEKSFGLKLPPKGKHLFGSVTVGDKGQIVIPVKARKLFHINPGDDLLVLGDETRGLALFKHEYLMELLDSMRKGE